MKTGLAILAILVTGTTALAQETRDELSVGVRWPLLRGEAAGGESWNEIFGSAVGLGADYARLFPVGDGVAAGPYASLSYDRFGDGEFESGSIDLDLDPLHLLRATVGGRFTAGDARGVTFAIHAGVGLSYYNGTDGDLEIGGVPAGSVEALERSIEPAFEIGLRVGVRVSETVGIAFTAEYEYNGAAGAGDGFTNADVEPLENLVLAVGVVVRLGGSPPAP